jgi:hypothetical protein
VVFVDPPFRKGLLEETLALLEQTAGWRMTRCYVESEVENGLPPVPAHWDLHREKVAGQVAYRLYQRQAQGESMPMINLGRLLMLCVWAFAAQPVAPVPAPAEYLR